MTDELIYDDGEIRNCDSNVIKLGYWGVVFKMWRHHSYFRLIKQLGYEQIWEACATFSALIMFIILFPILPFISAWFRWKSATRFADKVKDSIRRKND